MFERTLYQTIRAEGKAAEIERTGPFECLRRDAWLGRGYYYWETFIEYAHWWGDTALAGSYFICETRLSIEGSKVYDLANDTERLLEFEKIKVCLEEKYQKKLTTPFILEYLRRKGLLSDYCVIRARFDNATNRISSKVCPILGHSAHINLKPQIQICIIEKSILGENNYKVVHQPHFQGCI